MQTNQPAIQYFEDALLVACSPCRQSVLREDEPGEMPLWREPVVMIVDDEPLNIDLVQAYLEEAGFQQFVHCSDATKVISTAFAKRPDVILLDILMPEMNGLEVLSWMKKDPHLKSIPTIMLTSSTDAAMKLKALRLGATDFLAKPVDPSELALRLQNTLSAKANFDHLANYSAMLEHEVRLRTAELVAAQRQILYSLATAGEYRDQQTGRHVVRVGKFTGVIARHMGANKKWVEMIELAAPLHDVGKIGISDNILLKPGKLDPHEREAMQQHCIFGKEIIRTDLLRESAQLVDSNVPQIFESPIMQMAAVIAESHHERWDGAGYPYGLRGEQIPLEGRIVAVADVFDAVSSTRPYKKPFERDQCLQILRDGSGSHFDPQVVEAFFRGLCEIQEIQRRLPD